MWHTLQQNLCNQVCSARCKIIKNIYGRHVFIFVLTAGLQHETLSAVLKPDYIFFLQRIEVTPVTVAVSPKEIKVIKCNGVGTCKKKKQLYTLQPDYLSHIVVISEYIIVVIQATY